MTVKINDKNEESKPIRGCRVVQATLSGKSNPAQEQGSALTYARRYSLLLAYGLATTDDDAQCLTIPTTTQRDSTSVIMEQIQNAQTVDELRDIYSRSGEGKDRCFFNAVVKRQQELNK